MLQKRAIALIRHGDYQQPVGVPSALLPYPLTLKGEAQARQCGGLILDFCRTQNLRLVPQLDCSRQLRAWQTATLIAEAVSLETQPNAAILQVSEFESLSERSVGAVANLDIATIAAIVAADPRYSPLPNGWKSDRNFRLPFQGAESLQMAGERVASHLRDAWQVLMEGELKVIVGHGAAMRHAAAQLGLLTASQVAGLSMHHAQPVYISRDEQGNWFQLAGEWKIRRQAGDEFGE